MSYGPWDEYPYLNKCDCVKSKKELLKFEGTIQERHFDEYSIFAIEVPEELEKYKNKTFKITMEEILE